MYCVFYIGLIAVCVHISGEEEADLGGILQFVTGTRTIPPLGFSKKINIFHADHTKTLPETLACFFFLYLPQSESNEVFVMKFNQAMLYSLDYFRQE